MADDIVKLLAAWALVHETADEGWKAAVERGRAGAAEGMDAGPDAFVDGLSALVAEEKDRLKARLASGEALAEEASPDATKFEELRFEMGELRGRLESLEAAVDRVLRKLEKLAPGE